MSITIKAKLQSYTANTPLLSPKDLAYIGRVCCQLHGMEYTDFHRTIFEQQWPTALGKRTLEFTFGANILYIEQKVLPKHGLSLDIGLKSPDIAHSLLLDSRLREYFQ
jgi:hypothetical protein